VDAQHACFVGTMRATVKRTAGFHTMSNDFAVAVLAFRSERMNGAFEAIKIMGNAVYHDFQRFVVIVSADFTSRHIYSFVHSGF
jgi:hypothetical protein